MRKKLLSVLRKPHETVDPEEVIERFKILGVDLRKLLEEWTNFYENHGYAIDGMYLRQPSLTESAMKAFEAGLSEGAIDTIMIDDARFPQGDALKILQPETPLDLGRRLNSDYRPLMPAALEKLLIEACAFLTEENGEIKKKPPRTFEYENRFRRGKYFTPGEKNAWVRLVGINLHPEQRSMNMQEETESLIAEMHKPYNTLISLGTYTRLLYFLKAKDPQLLDDFQMRLRKNAGIKSTRIFLNSFASDGGAMSSSFHSAKQKKLVTPLGLSNILSGLGQISFVPVIQSDLPLK